MSGSDVPPPASTVASQAEIDERQRTNDLTQKQIDEIRAEVSEAPLLSRRENGFASLREEYERGNNSIILNKIKDLEGLYAGFRRVRGDGSCFYRSFTYSLLEAMIDRRLGDEENKRLVEVVKKSREELMSCGYDAIILDDFYEPFLEKVEGAAKGDLTHEKLFNDFLNVEISNQIIVYVRLLISCELKTKPFFYEAFIEPMTINEYCNIEVEPIDREADQIHIIALSNYLQVGLRIEYLDLSDTGKINSHNFYEDKAPAIFVLYRPGHYDCLYGNTM